jgi:hypothetical protein
MERFQDYLPQIVHCSTRTKLIKVFSLTRYLAEASSFFGALVRECADLNFRIFDVAGIEWFSFSFNLSCCAIRNRLSFARSYIYFLPMSGRHHE